MDELLTDAARRSADYLKSLKNRRVAPSQEAIEQLSKFFRPLQDHPLDPSKVLAES